MRLRMGLVVATLLAGFPASAQVLTLEDCVRLALTAPSSVTVARQETDIARAGVGVARAGFLPQARIDSSFAYNLGAGLLVMLPAHVGFRVDYRYRSTASDIAIAGQPLLATGTKLNFSRFAFALVLH